MVRLLSPRCQPVLCQTTRHPWCCSLTECMVLTTRTSCSMCWRLASCLTWELQPLWTRWVGKDTWDKSNQIKFFSSVNSRNLDVDVTYKLSVYLSMEQSVTSFSVSLFPLKVAFSTTEMALALNRYLCSAVLPLLTKCAPLYAGTDHRAIMIDSMLHTIYRLSRGRALTKAQRDVIEECLMSLCKSVSVPVSLFRKKILFIWHLNDDNSKYIFKCKFKWYLSYWKNS